MKEFAQNPATLRKLLEAAFKTLKSCTCRHDEKKHADGCYRCVYAFQRQFELGNISRERGVELLSKILERWDSLQSIETLTHVDLPDLLIESELERRFRSFILMTAQQKRWKQKKLIRNGAEAYEFGIGGRQWIMESQVKISREDGVLIPSQPDFVFRPVQEENGVLPIAVFTDGFAYHALPEELKGRIADDVQKRSAIIQSGRFLVWSLTWDDVAKTENDGHEPSLFADLALSHQHIDPVSQKAELPLDELIPRLVEPGSIHRLSYRAQYPGLATSGGSNCPPGNGPPSLPGDPGSGKDRNRDSLSRSASPRPITRKRWSARVGRSYSCPELFDFTPLCSISGGQPNRS